MMRHLFFIVFILSTLCGFAQDEYWFYLRTKDTATLNFKVEGDLLKYVGEDKILKETLAKEKIKTFKKTLRKAKIRDLNRTYFVVANNANLHTKLLKDTPNIFISGEPILGEDKKIYEPNDYGLTSTIGENIGMQANLDYLDVLGLPEAWYYTTGSRDVPIGISDGQVNPNDIDFQGKTTLFNRSHYAGGHGVNIAANAAAQGDNGVGFTGVCFDCSIYGTSYGQFYNYSEVVGLAKAGARVINCSWVSTRYIENGQKVMDSLFNEGVIVVAAAGNRDFSKTKGKVYSYPASYRHVISVSSGMYRHEKPLDNILQLEDGTYYTSNLRGSVGRTMGFPKNDTLQTPFVYEVSTAILNTEVDILAPTSELIMFQEFINKGEVAHHQFETTSGATPLVSGTIGLMFSLYPCLTAEEVEPILKITALNIDDVPGNKKFAGLYGAGLLQTGKAIKLLHDLKNENETAYIENQNFNRWDFTAVGVSKEIVVRNQVFQENANLDIESKNRIRIGTNTVLKPNQNGKIKLRINPDLENECNLRTRKNK
ncbi:S8 family serine peptidase [Aequorivita sp. SDUM287046]|uniref:S8 family serine peptidase n=1 Tax=Aequorivita aurantiaca TaxID=3053356 RepID=A0ABT8DK15_9FLAO|nr:S8 family serine peptidase [Aequorivita aurantiaca]MDN3725174.1 S8 family serine peptidase [Aequorivita aurantiaca]